MGGCMIARRMLLFTWPAWTMILQHGGAGKEPPAPSPSTPPINNRQKAEGGESGLNSSHGKASRWVSFRKPRLDHFLGEKRRPAFCRRWIGCDCLWYKGTGVQVMTVWFWQAPPSSSSVARCSTIWFGITVAMETGLFDWRPAFSLLGKKKRGESGFTVFFWLWGKYY